ncbi:MAG: MFS transporter [Chloroflexi bacterium]|nr:MFS transporter [Chloroflexota bacterium]
MQETTTVSVKKPGIFYGWVVVAVSFVTLAFGYGMRYSFPVFFVAMLDEFGWTRASTALAFSLHMVSYGFSSPLTGALLDRFGPRVVLSLGAAFLAVGVASLSLMQEQWHFLILYGVVVGIGVNLVGSIPHSIVLAGWFVRQRGLALGMGLAGAGVGMLLVTPAAQYIITAANWRVAYLIIASVIFVVVVPVTALFQRRRPEDMGLLPDGVGGGAPTAEARRQQDALIVDRAWAATDWTLGKALRTYRLKILFFNSLLSGIGLNLVLSHQLAHWVDVGYDRLFAAAVVGSLGILMTLGRAMGGAVSDRIGREVANNFSVGAQIVGIFLMMMARDASQSWMLYAAVWLFGWGYGAEAPVNASVTADLFYGRGFGIIRGVSSVGYGIGGFIGPWLGGYIFDTTGSYTWAFLLTMATATASCITIWIISPRKVRLVAGRAPKH